MRIISVLAAAALALVPITASAQTQPQGQPPPSTMGQTTGLVDFGVRGTNTDGDASRYERYRDLGNGFFLQRFRFETERDGWFINLYGDQAARRDQRYMGFFNRPGTFKAWAIYDQIPMLMSNTTRALFAGELEEPTGDLRIDPGIRGEFLANAGNRNQLAQFIDANSREFKSRSRRDIFRSGFEYIATPDLTVRSQFQSTKREGTLPYGASFGHSSLVEFPAPIQHRLNDFETTGEFARDPVLFRAGFSGSWFNNEFTRITVDNPYILSDVAGGGSSRGGLSFAPSNTYFTVNGLASVKLPARSRATAYLAVGSLKDAGDAIMGQTANTANLNRLTDLERTAVNGEGRTLAMNFSFTSRPNRYVDLSLRYRGYEYDNRTPVFRITQRVAYDANPGNATYSFLGGGSHQPVHDGIPGVPTEPFGVDRRTFDADLNFLPWVGGRAGIGYTRLQEDRSHRFFSSLEDQDIFDGTVDNTLRLMFDTVGNRLFSLRTKYEHAQRRAADESVIGHWEEELFDIGEQPGMRHFDVAERDRDRVTILGVVTPTSMVSFSASVAAGKDDYIESLFGLRDNTHRVYSFGTDVIPSEMYNLGLSYSFEKYDALLRSRQASPPNAAQGGNISFDKFLEESAKPESSWEVANQRRNWNAESADRVHSLILFAGVNRIAEKVDLQFSYDFNRAEALYEYRAGIVPDRTLPEEAVVETVLPQPTGLPKVTSKFNRLTADAVYAFTDRLGIGVSYWFERYRTQDYTLDSDSYATVDATRAVLLQYLYRPYTANTVWGRLIYRW